MIFVVTSTSILTPSFLTYCFSMKKSLVPLHKAFSKTGSSLSRTSGGVSFFHGRFIQLFPAVPKHLAELPVEMNQALSAATRADPTLFCSKSSEPLLSLPLFLQGPNRGPEEHKDESIEHHKAEETRRPPSAIFRKNAVLLLPATTYRGYGRHLPVADEPLG